MYDETKLLVGMCIYSAILTGHEMFLASFLHIVHAKLDQANTGTIGEVSDETCA